MKIERAKFARVGIEIMPFVLVGGVWYLVETKPSLIELGVATMIPVEDDLETLADEPVEHFHAVCPSSEKWGTREHEIRDATNNIAVWKVAKMFVDRAFGTSIEGLSEMEFPAPEVTEEEYRDRAKDLGIVV